MRVKISIGSQNVTMRRDDDAELIGYFRIHHELRRGAFIRFLREEVRVVDLGTYGKIIYEVDEEKLKKMERLLMVDIRTKDIKEALSGYVSGELSLDETYDRYLPLLIARKLDET